MLAAAAAVLEALALGLVGLGGSPPALAAAAGATWLAARRLLPAPRLSPLAELAQGVRALGPGARAALGAVAGLGLAYAAWLLRYPSLGLDGASYHLTEVVMWAQQGTPGSVEPITYEFPVGNYPLTNEVLLAWAAGISRSLPPVVLWAPFCLALAGAAGWLGLRRLEVGRVPAGLALAAVLGLPLVLDQLRGPGTDIPAFAWLLSCAALALCAQRRPALLAPALVAAGLAVGTKTTALPLAALALAAGFWGRRDALRPLLPALGAAALAAAAVGGYWYARNLVDHGSPFWPFLATSWGDPVPRYLQMFDASLLGDPGGTLEGRVGTYLDFVGGGPLLLLCALLAPLAARRRPVLAGAAAVAVVTFVWALGPFTGKSGAHPALDLSLSTTRYLLPVFAAAALTLALVTREGGVAGRAAMAVLGASAAWSVVAAFGQDFPRAPSPLVPLVGLGLGALAALVLPARRLAPALAAGAVGLWLVLAIGAPSFPARYGEARNFGSGLVAWLDGRAGFASGGGPVAFAPAPLGVLAGPRLTHDLELIPAREGCGAVRSRARRGLVVIRRDRLQRFFEPFTAAQCLRGIRPLYDDGREFRVYGSPR